MTTILFLLLALILISLWAGFYAIVKQQGRILLRLDQLEQNPRLAAGSAESLGQQPEPGGLPVATDCPTFKFPDLAGNPVALEDFRGKRLLLVHWNFQCGFCESIAPELARLETALEGRHAQLALMAYGDTSFNRTRAAEHGLKCPILLRNDQGPAGPFDHEGTPVAYLLDEEGRIAAPFAQGRDQVLSLARETAGLEAGTLQTGEIESPPVAPSAQEPVPPAPRRHRIKLPGFLLQGEIGLGDVIKRITSSFGIKACVGCERRAAWLNRWLGFSGATGDALKAGAPAPLFRLPDLQGGTVSLKEYRGRRVLLVFSDPHCTPCDELAPHLVRLHREHGKNGLVLVLVGHGSAKENRQKAQQHGFQFPVVIQHKWRLSKEYGILATPVAFLIGEDGVIAQDVAVGRDPIMALAQAGAGALTSGA